MFYDGVREVGRRSGDPVTTQWVWL